MLIRWARRSVYSALCLQLKLYTVRADELHPWASFLIWRGRTWGGLDVVLSLDFTVALS